MRSDVKSLAKLFGASMFLAFLVIVVFMLAAMEVIAKDVAVYIAFGLLIVGVIVLARLYGPSLTAPPHHHHDHKHDHKHKHKHGHKH